MKERPILMRGEMVRAILEGRKTQTRRLVKPQPDSMLRGEPFWNIGGLRLAPEAHNPLACPYGKPGDSLWVRETWSPEYYFTGVPPSKIPEARQWPTGIWFWADGNPEYGDWTKPKPGIHMPRW